MTSENTKICSFKEKLCIHPDWADCQFQYAGDEPEYIELWRHGEEGKMGENCNFLPEELAEQK